MRIFFRLGRLKNASSQIEMRSLCNGYNHIDNEFFFDRSPKSFFPILNFYRTGKLHLAEDMCAIAFSDDLQYWGISDIHIDICCVHKYQQKKDYVIEELKKENTDKCQTLELSNFGNNYCAFYRKFIWDLMENPTSSKAARVSRVAIILFREAN
jgi:hypothetical protein